MNYPQPPSYPQPYPTPPKPKRWPWILGIFGALLFGIVIGAAGNSGAGSGSARETVTVRVPAPDDGAPAETAQAQAPPETPAGPATTMTNGVYQVGIDVQAGQYKTAGPPADAIVPNCYWSRNKDDSGEFDSVISNGNVQGPGSVTVNDGEFVELSGDCTWTRVG